MQYADDLAYVHHTGFADLARGAADFIVGLLARRGLTKARVVDLGCGSGILLRALSQRGHDVVGVDLSRAMIGLSRKSAPAAKLVIGSLYDVTLPSCDLVLAVGEPISYHEPGRTQQALPPLFRKVRRALSPGGLFLFDVICDARGPSLSRRSFFDRDDWAVLVETKEAADRRSLTRAITTFRRRGPAFRRTRELHRVRVFRVVDVARALRRAGFGVRVLTSYGAHPLAVRRRAFLCTAR